MSSTWYSLKKGHVEDDELEFLVSLLLLYRRAGSALYLGIDTWDGVTQVVELIHDFQVMVIEGNVWCADACCLCSQHFSCNCHCEKTTSLVDLSSQKAALCLVVDLLNRFSIGYREWIFPGNFSIAVVSIALPFLPVLEYEACADGVVGSFLLWSPLGDLPSLPWA